MTWAIATVVVAAVAVIVVGWLIARGWPTGDDGRIDDLIDANRARPIPGMDQPDDRLRPPGR